MHWWVQSTCNSFQENYILEEEFDVPLLNRTEHGLYTYDELDLAETEKPITLTQAVDRVLKTDHHKQMADLCKPLERLADRSFLNDTAYFSKYKITAETATSQVDLEIGSPHEPDCYAELYCAMWGYLKNPSPDCAPPPDPFAAGVRLRNIPEQCMELRFFDTNRTDTNGKIFLDAFLSVHTQQSPEIPPGPVEGGQDMLLIIFVSARFVSQ